MKSFDSKYSNSPMHYGDEDVATLRTLIAQLMAEKAQPPSTPERVEQYIK
jgi:hypothetical protein